MVMKMSEIRKMKDEDLKKKLAELKLELMKDLANVKMGRPIKNPGKIRAIRKTIARILTVLSERRAGGKR